MILTECNNVQLLWVPGHKVTEGIHIAEKWARRGSLQLLIGPEPACHIISKLSAKKDLSL
jgi:hypothetical protein